MSLGASLPKAGDTIAGKYVLEHLLGQGGMGAVFSATHIKLSKRVAIKIMLGDAGSPEAAQRFVNEGRAAANIQSEHVVRVDDVDEELGYAYMVLELLEGHDLAQMLDREPQHRLAPQIAAGFVVQALRGVAQAHAIGIVHRDLKPSNLFVSRRPDGSPVVKVLDFGISKAKGSSALAASPDALTSTKAMLGSPLYMSPEQLRSSKSVDHRADIWAVGVILYELITGSPPFGGENLGELFAAILENDPVPLRALVPNIPPPLEQIVLACLQKRPEQRIQSANDLAAALLPFAAPHIVGQDTGRVGATAMLPPTSSSNNPPSPQAQSAYVQGLTPSTGHVVDERVSGGGMNASWTPQGMVRTGPPFQDSGSRPVDLPKSRAPIAIVGAIAGLALLVGVFVLVRLSSRAHPKPDPNGVVSVSATAPPPPSVSVALPEVVTSAAPTALASVDPPSSAIASASASAAPPVTTSRVTRPKTTKPPKSDDGIQNTR